MTAYACEGEGCGELVMAARADSTRLCAWCWTEQQIAGDERDEADDRYQQERDEVNRA